MPVLPVSFVVSLIVSRAALSPLPAFAAASEPRIQQRGGGGLPPLPANMPSAPAETSLSEPHVRRAMDGWTLRFAQLRQGLPIEGALLAVNLRETRSGLDLRVIENTLVPVSGPIARGRVSAEAAQDIARAALARFKPALPRRAPTWALLRPRSTRPAPCPRGACWRAVSIPQSSSA